MTVVGRIASLALLGQGLHESVEEPHSANSYHDAPKEVLVHVSCFLSVRETPPEIHQTRYREYSNGDRAIHGSGFTIAVGTVTIHTIRSLCDG